MHWRVIRLIAGRELRDLARDRRSVVLLMLLPVMLYPGFGLLGFWFALSLAEQPSKIGVSGLPQLTQRPAADVPPLVINGRFNKEYCDVTAPPSVLPLVVLDAAGATALDGREVDAVLAVRPDFGERLAGDGQAAVEVQGREGDEVSKLAVKRVVGVLHRFEAAVRQARYIRHGLPPDFDRPLAIREPGSADTPLQRSWDELRDMVTRLFPFMLVMWSLAGALHPAIDLCAGEKERGTMETLLISPAERIEIVAGKFLAVWTYSTLTAWWNLLWLCALCLIGAWYFQMEFVSRLSLLWCYLLVLPLSALFSSLCLAVGAYARSTKEGQYYLLPLFLGALPLVLFSLMPGVELTLGTSVIPVTGVCLLIQKMLGPAPAQALPYLAPALASLTACVAISAWWAVRQFHREDVLFRESESSAIRGWLASFGAET